MVRTSHGRHRIPITENAVPGGEAEERRVGEHRAGGRAVALGVAARDDRLRADAERAQAPAEEPDQDERGQERGLPVRRLGARQVREEDDVDLVDDALREHRDDRGEREPEDRRVAVSSRARAALRGRPSPCEKAARQARATASAAGGAAAKRQAGVMRRATRPALATGERCRREAPSARARRSASGWDSSHSVSSAAASARRPLASSTSAMTRRGSTVPSRSWPRRSRRDAPRGARPPRSAARAHASRARGLFGCACAVARASRSEGSDTGDAATGDGRCGRARGHRRIGASPRRARRHDGQGTPAAARRGVDGLERRACARGPSAPSRPRPPASARPSAPRPPIRRARALAAARGLRASPRAPRASRAPTEARRRALRHRAHDRRPRRRAGWAGAARARAAAGGVSWSCLPITSTLDAPSNAASPVSIS